MSVATSTAIAIGVSAAGAASSIASAKMQSGAAKKAATIQGASQDKAQAFNQQAFQQQQQALNPYIQGGQDAFTRLMSQHYGTGGLSPGMQGTAVQPGQRFMPPAPQGPPPQGSPFAQAMGGAPMGPQGPQALAAPPGGQPGGQMVNLAGPDGSVKAFPASEVPRIMQQAQAAGHAVRVVN